MAPPHTGAGAFTPMSLRAIAPFYVFALACYFLSPYVGLGSRDLDPRIAEVWPPGGVGFVLLTVIWHSGRRMVGGTLGIMFLVFAVTAMAMGYAPGVSLWLALTGVAQPLLMATMYRRRLSHPGWAPESPDEVAALLFAAVGSSVLLGVVGGFPFLGPGDLPSEVLLWWVLRNTVFCFVGGLTFMVMFYGRKSDVLPVSSWINRIGLIGTAALCVYGTYQDPSLPLSWLLIVPSVWGGLTLTVRGTAYLAITVALLAAAMTYLPQNQFGYQGILPASSIVDMLVIASTAFMLLLTLMREQRGALILELDRKGAESETQRQVLETVFESMNDGVVIVSDSKVTMYNSAARQLLGRPIPAERPDSWARAFDLSNPEGVAFEEDALRAGLFVADAGDHAKTLEVLVGHDDSARILDVTAQPLADPSVTARSTIVLLHDVTAQRARIRELGNFALMVAHDLRGPLTVLDGWLEVVQDKDSADEEFVLEEAVAKARDASKRMRQVIEDWLNYTVVQNGRLRPDAVKLDEIASEIVESRRASWADGDEPRLMLALSHSVEADPGLLRQLLDNLVGNAIKYTAADQVPWVLIASARDIEPGWVKVEVTDHGIGIPEGQEELIFEEFHRGPVEGRSAGTGLGLALTRRIVALHGGELTARSNPEGGSTFTFTLPEA
jgi:signal transduction histidine kinase/integral membrane sensor domain MASE1